MTMKEKMEALKKPFHPDEIEWLITGYNREKTKGLAVAYVSNRAVQNRLDEVFGIDGWKNEYKPWKDGTAQLCGISVWDEEKKEWITKWDGAEDTDIEPVKGGLSSAMKRAAGMYDIGRYLYDIEGTWVPVEPNSSGKGYHMVKGSEPALPAWALPEGTKNITPAPKPAPQTTPQQTTKSSPAPSPQSKLSAAQINRAYVKGRAVDWKPEDVENFCMENFGFGLAQLDRKQYDSLCNYLDSIR